MGGASAFMGVGVQKNHGMEEVLPMPQHPPTPPHPNGKPCLFFLVYINDLSEKITSAVKLFEDHTSLFSVVNEPNISASELSI